MRCPVLTYAMILPVSKWTCSPRSYSQANCLKKKANSQVRSLKKNLEEKQTPVKKKKNCCGLVLTQLISDGTRTVSDRPGCVPGDARVVASGREGRMEHHAVQRGPRRVPHALGPLPYPPTRARY
eukprot:2510150-Rhodomonas_salina.3